MNDWIEENAKKREDNWKRISAIKKAAPDVWKTLRFSVLAAADQYSLRFPPATPPYEVIAKSPNGFEHNEIWIEVQGPQPQRFEPQEIKRKLTVSFDAKANIITAKHSKSKALVLAIDLNDNGDPSLSCEGQNVSLDEATRQILLPLLFPDTLEGASH
jgi:hypothetical protein